MRMKLSLFKKIELSTVYSQSIEGNKKREMHKYLFEKKAIQWSSTKFIDVEEFAIIIFKELMLTDDTNVEDVLKFARSHVEMKYH